METLGPPPKWHSFKMILDPQIHPGVRKTVRYDGCLSVPPGGPGGLVSISPVDPRSKLPPALARWRRLESLELPVPRFRIDSNYVGTPPPIEVTLENLNDNVDRNFLERLVRKFGNMEELEIYYHPVRRKHLGLARIVFEDVKSARLCVKELHGKSVMGKQLNCYIDPFFASAKKMFDELTTERDSRSETTLTLSPIQINHQANSYNHAPNTDPRESNQRRKDSGGSDESARPPYYDPYPPTHTQHPIQHHPHHHTPSSSATPHGGSSMMDSSSNPYSGNLDYWTQSSALYAQGREEDRTEGGGHPSEHHHHNHQAAAEPKETKKDLEEEQEDEGEDQKMDLDTRLKLLMKKGAGSMPAFLLNELNSEEEEKAEEVRQRSPPPLPHEASLDNGAPAAPPPPPLPPSLPPLSRPPSPFLSEETYHASQAAWEESLRKDSSRPKRLASSRDSDQMSLSSLSSGDDKIQQEQQQQQQTQPSVLYPPPPLPSMPYAAPHFPYSGGTWGYDPYSAAAAAQQWGLPGVLPPPPPPMPGYPPQSVPPPPPLPSSSEDNSRKKVNLKDQYRRILDESVDIIVRDLKRTVRRDMSKKIGETFAFNLYDEWWQTKENEYKTNQLSTKQKRSSSSKPLSESNKLLNAEENSRPAPKAEDLSSLFDKQRDLSGRGTVGGGSFGAGGSLGFGFRGSIPKLPSFKIKPSEKKRRSESSDDDSSSRRREDDNESYRARRRRREERHRRRHDDDGHRHRRKSKERISSSSSKSRRHRRRSSSSHQEENVVVEEEEKNKKISSRTEKRREREIRRDKRRLKEEERKVLEDNGQPPEPPKCTTLEVEKEEELIQKSSKSQKTIYTSSSGDEREHKNESTLGKQLSPEVQKKTQKKKGGSIKSSKKILVSSSSSSEEDDELSSPLVETKEEKENKTDPTKVLLDPATRLPKEPEEEDSSPILISTPKSSSSSASEDDAEKVKKVVTLPPKPSVSALAATKSDSASSTDSVLDEEEEDKRSPPHIMDHCYAAVRPKEAQESREGKQQQTNKKIKKKKRQNSFAEDFANDHGYTKPRRRTPSPAPLTPSKPQKKPKAAAAATVKQKKKPQASLSAPSLPKAPSSAPPPLAAAAASSSSKWSLRDPKEQFEMVYRFLTHGLDLEDLRYLKSCYEMMLNQHANNKNMMWMNDTHWVDHPVTSLGVGSPHHNNNLNKKRKKDDFSRPHTSGSCRTEGYYKMDPREKMRTKYHLHRNPNSFLVNKITNLEGAATRGKIVSAQNLSREARNNQRRQLAVLGEDALNSDLLKFNQLKFRRKQMTFGKSAIHDWGLFAMEDIGADEMVIEYVGSVIRPVLSDVRENRYEKQGIGSSYLFRIDSEYVVDATKCGNLARFINHSCDPNCYAKIITIDGEKKIVIYSKQPIAFGEEITYDYKFPIEDEKIRCLCGSKNCRKYLN